jgi:hypothetical protein
MTFKVVTVAAALLVASTVWASVNSAVAGSAEEQHVSVPPKGTPETGHNTARSAHIKRIGGNTTIKLHGPATANLTSSDCRVLGGTVITPGDDRCGRGGTYCRFPDTMAMCIEDTK